MTDFTKPKIAIGLRQVTADIEAQCKEMPSPTARKRWRGFQDRINGYALELETEAAEPSAGTSAYTMMAEAERANLEVTETLIHMVAATVLAKLIADEGAGRTNIEFTPKDMDNMHRLYEIDAKRDGMLTIIKLVPRPDAFADSGLDVTKHEEIAGMTFSTPLEPDADQPEPPESFYATQDRDEAPAKEQAPEHVYDRPLWAARVNGKLFPASDKEQAERMVKHRDPNVIATIENRFCYHKDCPAERCNHAKTEVASEI